MGRKNSTERRFRVDITPLRTSRDFRTLLIASTVFYLGGMATYVALPFQIYQLTGSNLAVGLMGAVQLVPLVVFGLYGGALADHVDRRAMLLWTGVAQAVLMGLLCLNATSDAPRVWLLYVVGGLMAVASSLQRPSKDALLPRVVRHEELPAAVSLSGLGMQLGALLGPTLAGLLIAGAGLPWAFGMTVLGVVVATALYARLDRYPPVDAGTPPSLRGITEGIRYAVRRRDLLGTYVVDLVAMLMAMPIVLFPAFAQDVLGTPQLLGLLYTAETVGALAATLTSGWTTHVHHHGRAVVLAAAAWGAAIALAGLAPSVWVALGFLVVAGAADMVSGIFRGVIWNQTIPDSMRGRLAGIELLSYSVGPLGGQTRAGLVADLTSVRTSIVSGGILCVAGVGATAAALRGLWTYDARTDEHAIREREFRATAAGTSA
ncbi:MAG TPA: MFS transporter [Pseudonocardiaceae bacterium]